MKRVKIISAKKDAWYHSQIGSIFNVDECTGDYRLSGIIGAPWINIRDCEVIEEPTPQPEPFDLERAKNGEMFYSKDGFTRFKVVALSSFNDKLHIVETVRNGDANVEMFNLGVCSPDNHYMAPKEPEYVEGWVVVYDNKIGPNVYINKMIAITQGTDNHHGRTWKVEKIRFPKP